MGNKDVVIDMDGVLADFEGEFCKRFGSDRRNLVKLDARYPDKSKEIVDFVLDPETYKDLEILPLGNQIVKYLSRIGYSIHIVSSRPISARAITKKWLWYAKIPFQSIYVDDSVSKTVEIAKIKPLFALDDLLSVAEKLSKLEIPTLLISQPWNFSFSKKFTRIGKFPAFLYHFKKISGGYYDNQKSVGSRRSNLQQENRLASS